MWQELVPEFTLRSQQIEALDMIKSAFDSGVDVVVLEAPTGVGKSIIELALCRYFENGFIVTPQKTLQDQLGNLPEVKVMKGRGSYPCLLVPGMSAGAAPCLKTQSIRESRQDCCSDEVCPYFKALTEAKKASVVAHNYASLIAQSSIGGHFQPREIICLDEGHTAVDWIRNYMSLELSEDDLNALTVYDAPDDDRNFMGWFRAVMSELDSIPDGLSEKLIQVCLRVIAHKGVYGIPDESLKESYYEEMNESSPEDRYQYIDWAAAKLSDESAGLVPWHVGSYDSERGRIRKLTPIKVAAMANILTGLGKKVIIVTATALDNDLLVRELGLKSRGYSPVVIESAFDKSIRPIVCRYVGKMTYAAKQSTFPRLITEIENILSYHDREAGIIHTVSHSLATDVYRALLDSKASIGRQIVKMPIGGGRETTISKFLNREYGPNAVLIGPGLMEGIDGAYDSARWQVLCKVPWLFRKDPVVEYWLDGHTDARNKRFGEKWYNWKTVQVCVQGFGRVCRAADDFGVTYLLDSDFQRILKSDYVPDYVIQAVK